MVVFNEQDEGMSSASNESDLSSSVCMHAIQLLVSLCSQNKIDYYFITIQHITDKCVIAFLVILRYGRPHGCASSDL